MTSQSTEQGVLRNFPSPFSKIIATHYFEGPLEGFLEHCEWPEACVFQLLDWDRETDLRVYEIARIPGKSFEDVVAELFRDKLPTWPVWVLPNASRSRAEQLVDVGFKQASFVATVTTKDLFEGIALWDAAGDAPAISSGSVPIRKRTSDTG